MSKGTYTNEQHWREIGGGTVFTTGAALEAREVDGKWRWVVASFEDDTFWDGQTLSVNEAADTREQLVTLEPADEVSGDFESGEETEERDDQADYLLFGHNDGDFLDLVPED
jgi:hypothetical protein